MLISGLQKTSLLDYPGKISSIIFTSGCNFKCGFCHNPELVDPKKFMPAIKNEDIFDFLKKRKGILDAVVITGGEPTIHSDLPEFIKKIRKLGYLIKLDTNGTNPKMLKKLIDNKLVDYIAMDIKGPIEKYQEIVGYPVKLNNIIESIEIIKNIRVNQCSNPCKSVWRNAPDYEFRTTVVPTLHEENDFKLIGQMIKGAKKYYLQQFRSQKTLDPNFEKIFAYSENELHEFANIVSRYIEDVEIRGL